MTAAHPIGRFALFAGYRGADTGGRLNLRGRFADTAGAQRALGELEPGADWAHVVDLHGPDLPIVATFDWSLGWDRPPRVPAPAPVTDPTQAITDPALRALMTEIRDRADAADEETLGEDAAYAQGVQDVLGFLLAGGANKPGLRAVNSQLADVLASGDPAAYESTRLGYPPLPAT